MATELACVGRAQRTVRTEACEHTLAGSRWSGRPAGDSGATAVEYALIVTAIAGLIIAIVFVLGGKTSDLFGRPCNELAAATATTSC